MKLSTYLLCDRSRCHRKSKVALKSPDNWRIATCQEYVASRDRAAYRREVIARWARVTVVANTDKIKSLMY